MDSYKDFTIDPVNFAGLKDFVSGINANYSMKYIPIIDAGVAQKLPSIENYPVYNDGVTQDIFVKATNEKDAPIFTGQVWPVDAAFPDWFNNKTSAFWSD